MRFADDTAVRQIDSHTYSADLSGDWVIGNVPHGGYVTSVFQRVLTAHFATTLRKQKQPHTITLQLNFIRRTQVGPATFAVQDVKLGRTMTVVHITLSQDGRDEVIGYFNQGNIATEEGMSADTEWKLQPQPPAVEDFAALRRNENTNWAERLSWPRPRFRKATTHLHTYFPRRGQPGPSCMDMWYSWRDTNTRFTNDTLGFVCDMFPQMLETHMLKGIDPYGLEFEKQHSKAEQKRIHNSLPAMWYPTVCLSIDFKKALPKEGVDFLFLRVLSKSVKNGRYDLEVIVFDTEGDLVAVSNHVVMAVDAGRNTAARRKVDAEPKL